MGEGRDEGVDSEGVRAWICGARAQWAFGAIVIVFFFCVCESGDPRDKAWVWISIHTGSKMIAELHPAPEDPLD